ncbi:hypothetical protein ACVFYP_17330 [Roseomonas sp. F4]
MQRSPAQIRQRRLFRTAFVVVAVGGLAALLLGLGDVVSAALDPPAAVQPYDPLQRW